METTLNPDCVNDIKFENTTNFDIIIIGPNDIDSFDYNNPGYATKLVNENFNRVVHTSPDNFIETVSDNLDVNKYEEGDRNAITQVFYDKPEYFYEMMFLDIKTDKFKTKENENQFATMLNLENEKIYGNVIILKTYIPNDKEKSMTFSDISKDDLFEIIDSRVNTKVVIFEDGEFREDIVRGDLDIYCKNLFEEDHFQKKDLMFLNHNLNIWYLKNEYGTILSEKLISGKIEYAVFFSMKSDDYRGNITLDEVKKIVELSKSLEHFGLKPEWVSEEKDNLNRNIIKNKYKVLNYAWKEYLEK